MVHDFILDIFQISWHQDATAPHNEEVLFIPLAYGAAFLLSIEEHKSCQGTVPLHNYLEPLKLKPASPYLAYGQNSSEYHMLIISSWGSLFSPWPQTPPENTCKGRSPGFLRTVQLFIQLPQDRQPRTNLLTTCNLLTNANQLRNETKPTP